MLFPHWHGGWSRQHRRKYVTHLPSSASGIKISSCGRTQAPWAVIRFRCGGRRRNVLSSAMKPLSAPGGGTSTNPLPLPLPPAWLTLQRTGA